MNESKFSIDRERKEEIKQRLKLEKEKKADFFYALAKITFTALVVGIIVAAVQDVESIHWTHFVGLAMGCIATTFFYKHANNKLKI